MPQTKSTKYNKNAPFFQSYRNNSFSWKYLTSDLYIMVYVTQTCCLSSKFWSDMWSLCLLLYFALDWACEARQSKFKKAYHLMFQKQVWVFNPLDLFTSINEILHSDLFKFWFPNSVLFRNSHSNFLFSSVLVYNITSNMFFTYESKMYCSACAWKKYWLLNSSCLFKELLPEPRLLTVTIK